MELRAELEVATEIAREAGRLLLASFGTPGGAGRAKGIKDIITDADVASERLVVQRLAEAFGDDGVVAEEGSRGRAVSGRRWFIDPLDGTVNYSHGIPIWCVSLSLFEGERPVLGVIHDPIRQATFSSVLGGGASLNGKNLRCSQVERAAEAIVHITVDFADEGKLVGLAELQTLAPSIMRVRQIGSVALALAYTAAGLFDAVVHRVANPWDLGAGVLMVQEAGGCASDLEGRPYTETTESALAAATEMLHSELLDRLPHPVTPE
jgi:myo-inositol-1(or 4)-monophosphatase